MIALKYDVPVNYVKGPDVPIVDALSRVSPQPATSNGQHASTLSHTISLHLQQSYNRSVTTQGRILQIVIVKRSDLWVMATEKRRMSPISP